MLELQTFQTSLDTLLQKASQPDFDASIYLIKFGPLYVSDLSLFDL